METVKKSLFDIKENPDNPRSITDENMQRLVDSILELPKMLDIRPVVLDKSDIVLGGNMRTKALRVIAAMTPDQLRERLLGIRSVQNMGEDERQSLLQFWMLWSEAPTVTVEYFLGLTEAQKQAFIVKDNVSYGIWDFDALKNFDPIDLKDWGVAGFGDVKGFGIMEDPTTQPEKPQVESDNRERIVITFPTNIKDTAFEILGLPSGSTRRSFRIAELINK